MGLVCLEDPERCLAKEEKLKFYITSFSFSLPCPLQSLDHLGHVVSESGDLQY